MYIGGMHMLLTVQLCFSVFVHLLHLDLIFSCFCSFAVIMFLISWAFTVVSLALATLIYYYVSIKGKAGDWGDGFKSAYFQLALRSLRSLGGDFSDLYENVINVMETVISPTYNFDFPSFVSFILLLFPH
jgi:hypothetical protein